MAMPWSLRSRNWLTDHGVSVLIMMNTLWSALAGLSAGLLLAVAWAWHAHGQRRVLQQRLRERDQRLAG